MVETLATMNGIVDDKRPNTSSGENDIFIWHSPEMTSPVIQQAPV